MSRFVAAEDQIVNLSDLAFAVANCLYNLDAGVILIYIYEPTEEQAASLQVLFDTPLNSILLDRSLAAIGEICWAAGPNSCRFIPGGADARKASLVVYISAQQFYMLGLRMRGR